MAQLPCRNDSSHESRIWGSSSSISISLSSETTDDQPSTSGCSSMHLTGSEFKQMKKEKVKAYIQQIKSMLPPAKGRGRKTGTLTALQHVIDKLKKLKDNKDGNFEDSATDSIDHCSSTGTVSKEVETETLTTESFALTVTLDCRVDSVNESLLKFLGYPKDSWHGHLLTSYTSRKDIITVNNMLSKNESAFKRYADLGGSGKQKENTIYFRLRYYKNLNQGYGLKRQDKFCAFQANVTPLMVDTPISEKDRNILVGSKKTKHFYLRCVPLQPAYVGCSLPKNFTFSTTHNLYCNLSLISNSAITLLGFLPQDLIGMSIFELYHPDDLTYLQTIYQKVVSTQGFRFKSEPYRLRTRNQSWVYVETEWSATTNQWSKRLEDISGQHTVVRIPENPNIFDEDTNSSFTVLSEESQIQGQKLQRKIQEILLQQSTEKSFVVPSASKLLSKHKAAVAKASSSVVNTSTTKISRPEAQSKEGLMTPGSFIEEIICSQNDGNVSPAVSHSSSPPLQFDSDTSVTYEQLNYSYNIRRFLLSQPKTYHSDNSDKEDSKQVKSENCSDFCPDPEFVSVDIPILNPPSFGSSTKVLVSDQEPRDATSPPADEYFEDFIMHKELSISNAPTSISLDGQSLYQPVILTPEVLRMHTQLQERLYVQQATSDSSLFELDRGRSSDNSSNRNTQRPKRHKMSSSDQEDFPPSKAPRLDQSPVHFTNMQQAQMTNQQLNSQFFNKTPLHPQFYQPSYPVNMPYSKYPTQVQFPNVQTPFQQNFPQAIPLLQYDPSMHMTTNNSSLNISPMNYTQNTTTASMPTTYWPCYTQTGMPFVATQLVGRFYQPVPGMFHTFNPSVSYPHNTANLPKTKSQTGFQETNVAPGSGPNSNRKDSMSSMNLQGAMNKHNLKISESSCSTSSQEETSSSLMYILEAGSCNTSSPCPDMINDYETLRKNKRLPRDPFWLQNTNWSTSVRMKYTVPHKSLKHILKEDNAHMNSLCQSEVVQEQLRELKLSADSKMPVINEEEDFLIFGNSPQLNEDNDNRLSENEAGECEKSLAVSSQDPKSTDAEEETEIIVFHPREVKEKIASNKKSDEKTKKIYGESGKNKEHHQHSEKTESSDNDDDKSDSSSKNSSYLTTSDQRSNEEAGSSLKESDGASKESDSGSKESDNGSGEESKPTLMEESDYNSFYELFVPLSLRIPKRESEFRPSKHPPWLMKADFNENIKMGYHLKSKELDSILESDNRRMANLSQSNMVHEQLQTLLEEIEDCDSLGAETTAATCDYSGSEKLMDSSLETCSSTATTSTCTTFTPTTSTVTSATTSTVTTVTTNKSLTENQESVCSPSVTPTTLATPDVTMSPGNLIINSSCMENETCTKDSSSECQTNEITEDVSMAPASSSIIHSPSSPSYSMVVDSSEMPAVNDTLVSQTKSKAADNSQNVDIFEKLFFPSATEDDDFI